MKIGNIKLGEEVYFGTIKTKYIKDTNRPYKIGQQMEFLLENGKHFCIPKLESANLDTDFFINQICKI